MDLKHVQVAILLGPQFEDREVTYPYYRLLETNASVKLLGIGEQTYTGKYGIPLNVDGQCADYVNRQFDLVIIPGGFAPDKIRANQSALDIVRYANDHKAVVAAICHGAWVLASANIVKGKKITCYENIKDDVINAGAKWLDQEVVVDGNLVTSRKPDDLPAFCREIIKLLQLAKVKA